MESNPIPITTLLFAATAKLPQPKAKHIPITTLLFATTAKIPQPKAKMVLTKMQTSRIG